MLIPFIFDYCTELKITGTCFSYHEGYLANTIDPRQLILIVSFI